jgi:hypothetical protein
MFQSNSLDAQLYLGGCSFTCQLKSLHVPVHILAQHIPSCLNPSEKQVRISRDETTGLEKETAEFYTAAARPVAKESAREITGVQNQPAQHFTAALNPVSPRA